mmetsp:Transcript_48187/g.99597  ORF Transcript_48187/g.99597 Transcript_48187/m.99597 type:complete len:80 (-) Transcript_48187:1230-1469(-)
MSSLRVLRDCKGDLVFGDGTKWHRIEHLQLLAVSALRLNCCQDFLTFLANPSSLVQKADDVEGFSVPSNLRNAFAKLLD